MAQKDLGHLISELRKNANMTQQDLAGKINITDKAVSKWERGLSSPDISTIPKLAEVFGIKSEVLLNVKLMEEAIKKVMYEYVKVEMEQSGIIRKVKCTRHREIINEYASNGYRYAGFVPTKFDEGGIMLEMDLVFEKIE